MLISKEQISNLDSQKSKNHYPTNISSSKVLVLLFEDLKYQTNFFFFFD